MAQTYRDLVVWQKAMELVTEIYRSTETFPKEEIYGLSGQTDELLFLFPLILPKDRAD